MLKLTMDYKMTKHMLNNCTLKESRTLVLVCTRHCYFIPFNREHPVDGGVSRSISSSRVSLQPRCWALCPMSNVHLSAPYTDMLHSGRGYSVTLPPSPNLTDRRGTELLYRT